MTGPRRYRETEEEPGTGSSTAADEVVLPKLSASERDNPVQATRSYTDVSSLTIGIILLTGLVLSMVLAITFGAARLPIAEVLRTLVHPLRSSEAAEIIYSSGYRGLWLLPLWVRHSQPPECCFRVCSATHWRIRLFLELQEVRPWEEPLACSWFPRFRLQVSVPRRSWPSADRS